MWVEGTDLDRSHNHRLFGPAESLGQAEATSVNIVGDITYSTNDGSVTVGLIAQNNVEIPMYAPMGKAGTMGSATDGQGTIDMEVDAALIAQQGEEFVSRDASGATWGRCRNMITFFGSVSSNGTPTAHDERHHRTRRLCLGDQYLRPVPAAQPAAASSRPSARTRSSIGRSCLRAGRDARDLNR